MISIDKYGVCVWMCLFLLYAFWSHPHPCNHHHATHLTGSTKPLGLPIQVLVFCLNEKDADPEMIFFNSLSKVSKIHCQPTIPPGFLDRPKDSFSPYSRFIAGQCDPELRAGTAFLFHKLLEILSSNPPRLGLELVPSFPDSAGQGAMHHVGWNDHDPNHQLKRKTQKTAEVIEI